MKQTNHLTRRRFVRHSLEGAMSIGIGAAIPSCFADAAVSSDDAEERILVVVQLSGGNDGLNTVVPYRDDAYFAARPNLAIPETSVVSLSDDLGLHPSLRGFAGLLERGRATVIQSVGYENPNRSHFESMDIWHSCVRKDEPRTDGWIGRYLDSAKRPRGGDVAAIHLGHEKQPLAVVSESVSVPTVKRLDEFQIRGRSATMLGQMLESQPVDQEATTDLLGFVQTSTRGAVRASQRVAQAASEYRTSVSYPTSSLAEKFRTVAQLIDSGLKTRVYYVTLDGFDTHARQPDAHAILLREWSDAVTAFVDDIDDHGHGDRICVMTFSEFGRRVAENASDGTDHGAAGPMFMCGGGLQSEIIGDTPDLSDLVQGDLKHTIDFRSVYASIVQDWLGADPDSILKGQYAPLPLFRTA